MNILRVVPVLLLAATVAVAEDDGRTIRPLKVDNPPTIDGMLDDPVWRTVEPINNFIQWEPDIGVPVSEKTEVRICYDSHFLYFGIRAYDRDPNRVSAKVYERDSLAIDDDDTFTVGIDSLNDDRTAVAFDTNLLGTQLDVQLIEGGAMVTQWDGIWYTKGNRDEQGFTLEIAIPFFILRFKPAEEVEMGLILERIIRHRNEKSYWPAISRDHNFGTVSQWGRMVGLKGIERGVDLEVKPYGIAGASKVYDSEETTTDAGVDVKWGITSNMTADITFNTDFAQVESDALQVNLTRFNLFYPEQRDFFLERRDLFQFGRSHSAEIFFSRRIGIDRGREIPILGGARLYGLVGDTNVGLMTMQTREEDGFPAENFTVARVKQNIWDRSYFGGIFTSRRGNEREKDTTFGLDFQHIFGLNNRIWGSLATNRRMGIDHDNWFGYFGAEYLTDLLQGRISYMDVGPNFNPGIGFIRRNDQRALEISTAYRPRPDWGGLRQIFFNFDYSRIYDYAGEVETQAFSAFQTFLFHSSDQIGSSLEYFEELVPFPFYIAPDVVVPAGQYSFTSGGAGFSTARNRRIYLSGGVSGGGFYGGDILSVDFFSHFTFVPQLQMEVETYVNRVTLPTGEFTSTISRLFFSYYLSPTLISRVAMQYSSLEEDFIFNFRLRWIYAPGSEAWLVYDEGRNFEQSGSSFRDRALILKIVHNFHF